MPLFQEIEELCDRLVKGVTFRRVFFPDVSDLRSVLAIDERDATVTTTDGRVFKTDDGGRTWELKLSQK